MLVGRESERRLIEALVAGARVGESAVLVLRGEAGIGKTVLLEDAAELAAGMRLLRATGTESEREVPFGGLLQLLRAALGHLDRIPEPQADALAAALALRPAGDRFAVGTGGDRFAVGAATLSLLSRFAEDGPVAVLVDDAHLLDRPSAEALTFAARRLTADPVVVLAALRSDEASPLLTADLPVLDVAGIDLAAATALLAQHWSGGPRDELVGVLHRATGGNPLALLELADERNQVQQLPPDTPLPVPASLVRVFADRTNRLGRGAQATLLVVAVCGGDLRLTARACESLGLVLADLGEAERAALIRVRDDHVDFVHPLMRSSVYGDAEPQLRRVVHRAVADALPAEDIDRRAWHLAEAVIGPDEVAATLLERVAVRARGRRAHAVAVNAFERSARLTSDVEQAAGRLVAAGEAAWFAGEIARATALLVDATRHASPALRLHVAELRGAIAARRGSLEEAREILGSAAAEAVRSDPDTALVLLADTMNACFYLADSTAALAAAERAEALLSQAKTERARIIATMAVGTSLALAGQGGIRQLRDAVQRFSALEPQLTDERRVAWLVLGPLFLREAGTGRELVRAAVDEVRRRSAVGALPYLLFHLARDEATTDRWSSAEATYAEAVRLARETGETTDLAACLAGLAWLEARQGHDERCRRHAREAMDLCERHHIHLFRAWCLFALGELELGLGSSAAAVRHLQQLSQALDKIGVLDVDLSPTPELIDALLREGRRDEARDLVERYGERAADKGQPWAMARACRVQGEVGDEDAFDGSFQRALELHAHTLDGFETARTQLAYGVRLRRARRRLEARPQLRTALETFERLGARPWADRAALELKATGETALRRDSSTAERLTPQELQVALLLAEGRTTREAAAALFLSPKTVEYHLRHVYTKLGIGSRAELADAVTAIEHVETSARRRPAR